MSTAITILTAPAELPLTIEELKTHLRFPPSDGSQDGMLTRLIGTATAMAEQATRSALVERTLQLSLDTFPDDDEAVYLPLPPLLEVMAVKYLDTNGQQQTLDAADYTVDVAHVPGRVAPAYGKSWPDTRSMLGSVTFEFRAGYEIPEDAPDTAKAGDYVPDELKAAVLLLAAHLYENAEATTTLNLKETPLAVRTILEQHTVPLL